MHTNRLANEKSPYLLQHAHNPVDWYAWGPEAFQKAKAEDKPIFLSIGYSTCHWCHVMERESFENEELAEVLNRYFVPVKVDREERPDVDRIYMMFVQATTGGGGWPMSVWLTPDLKPFYGGTYFPPEDRWEGTASRVSSNSLQWLGRATASGSLSRASIESKSSMKHFAPGVSSRPDRASSSPAFFSFDGPSIPDSADSGARRNSREALPITSYSGMDAAVKTRKPSTWCFSRFVRWRKAG